MTAENLLIIYIYIYELTIYPFVRNRLPSMLKRIGMASFLAILLKITYVCWLVAGLYIHTQWSSDCFLSVSHIMIVFIFQCIISTVYEFVCAQSPYSKRGILIGYTTAIVIFSLAINQAIFLFSQHFFNNPITSIVRVSIESAFSVTGFLLHCIVSHKYKMRVRETYRQSSCVGGECLQ